MVELQIAEDFFLYSFALTMQEISQLPEVNDRIIQLVQRDVRNPLNERIYVRNDLTSVFRPAADIRGIPMHEIAKRLFDLRCRYHV